jgi:hypothetical protein
MTDHSTGQAHVIEIDGVAAGIVVAEEGGFRFFSAQRSFDLLDRRLFRSLKQATSAAQRRLQRKMPPRKPRPNRTGEADLMLAIPGPFLLPV